MDTMDTFKVVAAMLIVAIGGDYFVNDGNFSAAVLYAISNMF